MSNAMRVNGMSGWYGQIFQSVRKSVNSARVTADTGSTRTAASVGTASQSDRADFTSAVKKYAYGTAETGVSGTDESSAVSTKDMSLEEYKQYIKGKISEFPWNPANLRDSWSVDISEAGFKAMQADPEYEKWVLDDLKGAFANTLPGWARAIGGDLFATVHYGATKEECHCMSWYNGYQNGHGKEIWESKSKGSFWKCEGASSAKSQYEKTLQKKADAKRELEKKWQRESYEKRRIAGILSAYESGTFF